MLLDRAGLTPELLAQLAAEVGGQATLSEVVRWSARRGATLLDVIVQDEYTHDVVLELAGGARFLVYDTT